MTGSGHCRFIPGLRVRRYGRRSVQEHIVRRRGRGSRSAWVVGLASAGNPPGLRMVARPVGCAQGNFGPRTALALVRQAQGGPPLGQAAVRRHRRPGRGTGVPGFVRAQGAKGGVVLRNRDRNDRCRSRKFRQNAADRQLDLLKPADATKAREALVGIIERATERLTLHGGGPSGFAV